MNNNVVFLDCTSDYTFKFSAANTKMEFMAKGLVENGDVCTIHDGVIGSPFVKTPIRKQVDGVGNVLLYPKKGNQLISWTHNIRILKKDLRDLYKEGCQNIIILSDIDYHIFLLYIAIARNIGYKIVCISHEWGPTVKTTHFLRKPFVYAYSWTFGRFCDGILPISEYIIRKIRHFNKPYLKMPILADFSELSQDTGKGNFFLYCGHAGYKRVILKIIDAFSKFSENGKTFKLIFVLYGKDIYIDSIKHHIFQKHLEDGISIMQDVPYQDLWNLYKRANGLIIPLDPSVEQDEARFSQKIAEYISSSSPIITNNVGEIRYYFEDKKNAIICTYDAEGFSSAMTWIARNPEKANSIGKNGYLLGEKEFNYRTKGKALSNFLKGL